MNKVEVWRTFLGIPFEVDLKYFIVKEFLLGLQNVAQGVWMLRLCNNGKDTLVSFSVDFEEFQIQNLVKGRELDVQSSDHLGEQIVWKIDCVLFWDYDRLFQILKHVFINFRYFGLLFDRD